MSKAEENMRQYRRVLNSLGFTDYVINSEILPEWWDDDAAETAAGLVEAIIYAARYSGIDYRQLYNSILGESESKADSQA